MSEAFISTTNTIFSLGTIGFQALAVLLLVGLISKDESPVFQFFGRNAMFLVFLVSFAGMLGSLFYQYVIGFAPCMLCWYQRIVMYPTVLITLVALVKKKSAEALDYALILSILGALIALWHNVEKFIGVEIVSCDASGPSCLQNLVKGFGYIDIPVMSLTFFVLIILIIITRKRVSPIS